MRKSHNVVWLVWHLIAAVLRRRSPKFISDYGGGTRLEVECERGFPVEIDGDYCGTTKHLVVELMPGALQVVVPRAARALPAKTFRELPMATAMPEPGTRLSNGPARVAQRMLGSSRATAAQPRGGSPT